MARKNSSPFRLGFRIGLEQIEPRTSPEILAARTCDDTQNLARGQTMTGPIVVTLYVEAIVVLAIFAAWISILGYPQ